MSPVVVYIIIGTVGVIAAVILWKAKITAGPTILLFAAVASLAYTSIRYYRDDAARTTHDQCIGRVERAEGNRSMWLYIIDLLTPNRPELATDIRNVLDEKVPALSAADCPGG